MAFLNKMKSFAEQGVNSAVKMGDDLQKSATSAAVGFTLEKECDRATKTLKSFLADPGHPRSALNAIPKAVLLNAKGLAVFTIVKAGFIWSGRAGSGVMIARLPDGSWSAPSCIATTAIGLGFQIGGEISECVIVLNNDEALTAMARGDHFTIGGQLGVSAGPIGTGGSVNTALTNPTPVFTYSKSRGLFAGISLEGTVLFERKDANANFYGQRIPAADLLRGKVPPPEAANALYTVVEKAEGIDESSLPSQSYVPDLPPELTPSPPAASKKSQEKPIFDAAA